MKTLVYVAGGLAFVIVAAARLEPATRRPLAHHDCPGIRTGMRTGR
jgi:hypothetical protein